MRRKKIEEALRAKAEPFKGHAPTSEYPMEGGFRIPGTPLVADVAATNRRVLFSLERPTRGDQSHEGMRGRTEEEREMGVDVGSPGFRRLAERAARRLGYRWVHVSEKELLEFDDDPDKLFAFVARHTSDPASSSSVARTRTERETESRGATAESVTVTSTEAALAEGSTQDNQSLITTEKTSAHEDGEVGERVEAEKEEKTQKRKRGSKKEEEKAVTDGGMTGGASLKVQKNKGKEPQAKEKSAEPFTLHA
uniref:Uncharacterized protein n=1 Tax=Chromera velia CCMP2878 TaxID=1169474 RepID=A0A0G4G6E7_9ALVE|eukprot:Cvel_20490.t1-p1 / transcript=Cvel_20490.t1 / gene=Cvel_20490 / organism=Chromera_velia_CCMP2878 / gene_product=hypothetical protein / transcript_product=hypothetical protein / location=Cvel_scaffold1842:34310-36152(+) / protein_length=251 / sequence_SO=supercontig / SO=protein_coding / is_pseudo=false